MKILTIILAILFAIDNLAIGLLIEAVLYLLDRDDDDVIDVLLELRRERNE